MSKEHPSSNLQMIPIDKIEVLNPRDRNGRIFDDIVGNIKNIGLKKPITVTPRKDGDGREKFLLICGEGRLKAFKSLGETTIPAMVVDVSDEDGFIMSLAENIARRQGPVGRKARQKRPPALDAHHEALPPPLRPSQSTPVFGRHSSPLAGMPGCP